MGRRWGGMASRRWSSSSMRPEVASSKPARMRSNVVLPEPLSPSRVRNSPCSTSNEMDASTVCSPKRLPTLSRRRKTAPFMLRPSLAGLHFVPDLGVLRTAAHVLAENDAALVIIEVVQVQAAALVGGHHQGGLRVGRNIAGHVAQLFLRLGGNEVVQKLIGEFLVFARRRNHQVIDPPGGAFGGNLFLDGNTAPAQLVGHQRPAHGCDDFVVLKEIGQLSAGGPKLADIRL